MTRDEQGVLAKVSAAVSACKVNISRFHTTTTTMDRKAYMDMTVDVRDVNHLNEVIHRIEGVGGVLSVERAPEREAGKLAHLRFRKASAPCRNARSACRLSCV